MGRLLARFFDLRAGEGRVAAQAFAVLFLVIAGHTMLETARDALFLSKLPPSQLNIVYIALAALSFVVTAGTTAFTVRFGQRSTLVCALVLAAYATTFVHHLPPTKNVILGLYLLSGAIGAVLSPLFWTLAAQLFTVAQGRRLFGPIASGGVFGGVAGASAAGVVLAFVPVTTLLPVAAAIFMSAAIVVTTLPAGDLLAQAPVSAGRARAPAPRKESRGEPRLFRGNPFLTRLALLVALSTAAVLVVDYLFKSTAAREIPAPQLGQFFARYYALMNVASLVMQLVVAGALLKRFGVVGSLQVMPFLLLGGGIGAFVSGGALLVVLLTKGVDGSLRYSLNRVATELLYLPVPPEVRSRAKALIDTVLARVVQAAMAGLLFALAMTGLATPRALAVIIAGLCCGWIVLAASLARPYLDLFRKALAQGSLGTTTSSVEELDLASAEAVIEMLSSADKDQVIAGMDLLAARKHVKLVPALMLRHDDAAVVLHALELFTSSSRADWIPLAERLLQHEDDSVRIAALRALAKRDVVAAIERATQNTSSAVQAYAAFNLAMREVDNDLFEHPLIQTLMKMPGDFGDASRRGLLAAITDAPDPRAANVLLELIAGQQVKESDDVAHGTMAHVATNIARAIGKIKDPRFIPLGIERLKVREGREAVRDALVQIGAPALDALSQALNARSTTRDVMLQIPLTLARFRSQDACDLLVERLVVEKDGHLRFRVLRALGRLVAEADVKVDRLRIEELARKNLKEHLYSLAMSVALHRPVAGRSAVGEDASTGRLLLEFLDDKARQALERAFRLLKIAHRREDIRRVSLAILSTDKRARANAVEFMNTLLSRRDQHELRELFRVAVDDVSAIDRIARASAWIPKPPRTPGDALTALVRENDEALAAVAAHYAMSLEDGALHGEVTRVLRDRPGLESVSSRLFGLEPLALGLRHA